MGEGEGLKVISNSNYKLFTTTLQVLLLAVVPLRTRLFLLRLPSSLSLPPHPAARQQSASEGKQKAISIERGHGEQWLRFQFKPRESSADRRVSSVFPRLSPGTDFSWLGDDAQSYRRQISLRPSSHQGWLHLPQRMTKLTAV